MKALLASSLTALVLVSAAWASNVTPAQLAALSHRVAKLEKANAQLKADAATDRKVIDCVRQGWNSQTFQAYATLTSDGWPTKSTNLTVLAAPSTDDGVTGLGYLISVPSIAAQC